MRLKQLLWRLAGEEVEQVAKAPKSDRYSVTFVGAAVLCVLLVNSVATYSAFIGFIGSQWVALGGAIFVTLLVANLYLFLLYTFNGIPVANWFGMAGVFGGYGVSAHAGGV